MVERVTILTFAHNHNIKLVLSCLDDAWNLADIQVVRNRIQKVHVKLTRLLKYTG